MDYDFPVIRRSIVSSAIVRLLQSVTCRGATSNAYPQRGYSLAIAVTAFVSRFVCQRSEVR